jgi:hypothetical protein
VWLEYHEKGQVKLTVVPSTLNSKLHIPGTTLTQQLFQYLFIQYTSWPLQKAAGKTTS